MTTDYTTLAQRLDQAHEWPCCYTFKFIVPKARQEEVVCLFGPEAFIGKTASRTGKYMSITVETGMESSAQVIDVYKRAATIQGIVML
ncbi:DUF493 family protein [Desulfoplanes formicivorans]|uniref:DUF493 domain-containing protein n=1 Tax=Desulfoplanes formicivorans TaxID=1592317 RepID=A0A194AIZ3_9BACT|nr:DUF493 family protein [Desulfoplanes formicivorans]GAU08714.1 hypothetical protein DPF_1430 [Desulfoplanes formicivorans]